MTLIAILDAEVEAFVGADPYASMVSRVFHPLEDEYQAWKTGPLAADYLYAFADGTYFTAVYDAEGHTRRNCANAACSRWAFG